MHTKTLRPILRLFVVLISFLSVAPAVDAQTATEGIPTLQNPITAAYLKKNLRKSQPRLVLNRDIEKRLKQQLTANPAVQNLYKAIQRDAAAIQNEPLDRKSTRLNSSHVKISYAVFCLKKKK